MATLTMNPNNVRLRTMLIPREHGAWGMLLVPLATGAVAAMRHGVNAVALALFVVAALALFWLRTPVEAWFGTSALKAQTEEERSAVLKAALVAGVIALASIGWLFFAGLARGLLMIGCIAALAFAMQALVRKLGRKGRMPAQIIGAIGLTSTAAGAYYVATGRLDSVAVALWIANWLFASDQIHFVQVRIRSSRVVNIGQKLRHGYLFAVIQVVLLLVIVAGSRLGTWPAFTVLAFAPVLVRGTLWFVRGSQPLNVHWLGITELAHALIFGVLLSTAFLI